MQDNKFNRVYDDVDQRASTVSESDNTGAPQGTVLSAFLFPFYTTDFSHGTETSHLQMMVVGW